MSQLSNTVFGSCGLMVGWNIAPPPPGPIIWKLPGRGSLPLKEKRTANVSRTKNSTIRCLPLLSLSFLRFLFGRNALLCQSPASRDRIRVLFHSPHLPGLDVSAAQFVGVEPFAVVGQINECTHLTASAIE